MQKQRESDRVGRTPRRRPVEHSARAAQSDQRGVRRAASRAESDRESDSAQQNARAPSEDPAGLTARRRVVGLAASPASSRAGSVERARIPP